MKQLEKLLDEKVTMIVKREVTCPQKSCKEYGRYNRCYIGDYDKCKYRLDTYLK